MYDNLIPKDILIEVTNKCNNACIFCVHRIMKKNFGKIDVNFTKRILREAYAMGVRRVGFYMTGEMFLCEDIAVHIANAKQIGYEYIYSDTNGLLASRENLEKVIGEGLDSIKFSINAGTRQSYKEIHGVDAFEKVLENLRICHELKNKMNKNMKIIVSFIITKKLKVK